MKKTNCNLSGIGAETFISLFAQSHEESHGNVTAKAIETLLGEQFGYQVVPALKFLLDNTTPAALVRFVYDFMSPRSVVAHSTASIMVRPIPWQMKRTGQLFSACGESYQPFAMTAHSHLSITPDHIVFEGEAECLLELYFR